MGGTAQDDGSVVGKSAFPAKSLRFSEGLIAVTPHDQRWQRGKLGEPLLDLGQQLVGAQDLPGQDMHGNPRLRRGCGP